MTPVSAFSTVAASSIQSYGDCVITKTGAARWTRQIPASVVDVVEIGLGYAFACALTKSEKVLCWVRTTWPSSVSAPTTRTPSRSKPSCRNYDGDASSITERATR